MTNRFRAPRLKRDFATSFTATLLVLALPNIVLAANLWDGGADDDSWGSATNWDDNAVPLFPAALTFGGNTRLSPSNGLTDVTVNGITFAAGAGAFTLKGNPFTLAGNIAVTAGGVTTNTQTFNLDMVLGTSPTVTTTLRGPVVFNGALSGANGLTLTGTGYSQFCGTNTYSGDTTVHNETYISIASPSPFGSGRVKFGAASGAPQQWIVASGADRTLTNNVDINTVLFVAHNPTVAGKLPANLTLAGAVSLKNPSSGFYVNANNLTLAGPVSGGGGAGSIFELRAGKLTLQGANTFTNSIRITHPGYGPARTLNINADAALGHTNNSVRFDTSATFQLAAASTVALSPTRVIDITSGKTATFDIPSGSSLSIPGAITNTGSLAKINAGALTLAGPNTFSGGTWLYGGALGLSADASLGAPPAAPATNLSVASSATLRAEATHALSANRTLWIGTNVTATFDTQSYTQTVNGTVAGAPGSWLAKTGSGVLQLAPGADRTNVVSSLRSLAGTLAFADGTHLVTSNTIWNLYPINDIFHVNGGEVRVSGGRLMTTGDGYATVQNGALTVTAGTLDLNSLRELLNAYSGTGNTTVGGSGVLDLQVLRITQSGTPAVSNVVNVNAGGTIRLRNFSIDTGFSNPYGTVNLNGGTLVAKTSTDGFIGYNTGKWVTNVFLNVLAGGAMIDSGTNSIAVQLPLNAGEPSDGGLTKKGDGLLTLANTNGYSGLTTVEAGTLRLGTANTLLPGNAVLVGSNGVFDVNGKAQTLAGLGGSGLVTNNSLLAVTAEVEPGGPLAVGQLTLAAAPASLAGTFRVDVATNGVSDRLHVRGNLNLSGLALELANPGGLEKHAQYVIASCTGALTVPFQSAALPTRWHLTYNTAGGEVRLCYNFGTLISVR